MIVAFATDHGGWPLREAVLGVLQDLGCRALDFGTDRPEPCDYPPLARQVAEAIVAGRAERGILLCGSGVGMCVAANKVPGIRACVCHDSYSAHQGVEHDAMNVLCLGGRVIAAGLARELVRVFVQARFDGRPHHARRLEQLARLEKDVLAGTIGKTSSLGRLQTRGSQP